MVNAWSREQRTVSLCRWWATRRICRRSSKSGYWIHAISVLTYRGLWYDPSGFISGRARGSDFFILTNSLLRFIGFQPGYPPARNQARTFRANRKAKRNHWKIQWFTIAFTTGRLEGLFFPSILGFSFELLVFEDRHSRRRTASNDSPVFEFSSLSPRFIPPHFETVDLSVRFRWKLECRFFGWTRVDRFTPISSPFLFTIHRNKATPVSVSFFRSLLPFSIFNRRSNLCDWHLFYYFEPSIKLQF